MNYDSAFYLEGRRGNNAFSYDKRGDNPKLFVSAVKEGTLNDLSLEGEVVFEDEDEHGVLQSCKGLEFFLKTKLAGVPAVIVDNHNHVFYFWYEALQQGILKPGATLIHVDQHKDMRVPESPLPSRDLEAVFKYANEVLNVGNYIVPAHDDGLLSKIVLITGESDFEKQEGKEDDNKILNIDLDFFAPEMDYVSFEKAKHFIHEHVKNATLITIATSPFFIGQELAIQRLKDLKLAN
ncbi:MAG: UPF0489 family protein [Patescibacteria group bacterium]